MAETSPPVVVSQEPVTLAGGGDVRAEDLAACLALAPRLVAADGGADRVLALGAAPEAVIGDMDSISATTRATLPPGVLSPVGEQDSTDFEKCLTRTHTPLILALGVTGPRSDHALAAFNLLLRFPARRCILVNHCDVITLCPPAISLPLSAETRLSLFPLSAVSGRSTGLFWPIDGIDFAPHGLIGTSNRAIGQVALEMDAPGMLLILPRSELGTLVAAFAAAARWDGPD